MQNEASSCAIYVHRDGENYGPFTQNDAYQRMKDGELQPNDWAFQDGDKEMKPLLQVLFPKKARVKPKVDTKAKPHHKPAFSRRLALSAAFALFVILVLSTSAYLISRRGPESTSVQTLPELFKKKLLDVMTEGNELSALIAKGEITTLTANVARLEADIQTLDSIWPQGFAADARNDLVQSASCWNYIIQAIRLEPDKRDRETISILKNENARLFAGVKDLVEDNPFHAKVWYHTAWEKHGEFSFTYNLTLTQRYESSYAGIAIVARNEKGELISSLPGMLTLAFSYFDRGTNAVKESLK